MTCARAEQMRNAASEMQRQNAGGAAASARASRRGAAAARTADARLDAGRAAARAPARLQLEAQQIAEAQRRIAAESGAAREGASRQRAARPTRGGGWPARRRSSPIASTRCSGGARSASATSPGAAGAPFRRGGAAAAGPAGRSADARVGAAAAQRPAPAREPARSRHRTEAAPAPAAQAQAEQQLAARSTRSPTRSAAAMRTRRGGSTDAARSHARDARAPERLERQVRDAEAKRRRRATQGRAGSPRRAEGQAGRGGGGDAAAAARASTPASCSARARRSAACSAEQRGRRRLDPGGARVQPVGARHRGVQAGLQRLGVACARTSTCALERYEAAVVGAARPSKLPGSAERRRQRARARRLPAARARDTSSRWPERRSSVTFANPLPWWALLGRRRCRGAAVAGWPTGRRRSRAAPRRAEPRSGSSRCCCSSCCLMRPVAAAAMPDAPRMPSCRSSSTRRAAWGSRTPDGAPHRSRARAADDRAAAGAVGALPDRGARVRRPVLAPAPPTRSTRRRGAASSARRSQAVRERYRGRAVAGIVAALRRRRHAAPGGRDGAAGGCAGVCHRHRRADRRPRSRGARASPRRKRCWTTRASTSRCRPSATATAAAPIELRLLENGRPIEVRRVTPAADGAPISAVFHVAPGRGAADGLHGRDSRGRRRARAENNARSVLVQPPRAAAPRPARAGRAGLRAQLPAARLGGDTGLEVDSVVRKGKNEQGGDTFYIQAARRARRRAASAGIPTTRRELFAYDAIVLANVEGASLTAAQLEATRDFVGERGGGLLVLGAQSFLRQGLRDTPLEEVLPLDLADRGRGVVQASATPPRGANRVALTAAGRGAPDHAARGRCGGDAQALGGRARAGVDLAARRSAARRQRARGDQRSRRHAARARRRAALRRRAGRWSSPARRRGGGA